MEFTKSQELYPNRQLERHNITVKMEAVVDMLEPDEVSFLEWATVAVSSYYGDVSARSIITGHEYSECYPRVTKILTEMFSSPTSFDYIYDEYHALLKALNSQDALEELQYRTCPKCETRFETVDGMHRHKSRCKGDEALTFVQKLNHPAFRGEYKSRATQIAEEGWTDAKTSQW
jgi:hypothetical protein